MDIDGESDRQQQTSTAENERKRAMLERIREWSTQGAMDVANERLLDWI